MGFLFLVWNLSLRIASRSIAAIRSRNQRGSGFRGLWRTEGIPAGENRDLGTPEIVMLLRSPAGRCSAFALGRKFGGLGIEPINLGLLLFDQRGQ